MLIIHFYMLYVAYISVKYFAVNDWANAGIKIQIGSVKCREHVLVGHFLIIRKKACYFLLQNANPA